MTASRRVVRATPQFFDDLDRQLSRDRGPRGQPSVNDFQTLDLFRIVEVFAEHFDSLTELIVGRSDYRALIGTGYTVAAFVAVGQLSQDGAVELVSLDLDFGEGWDEQSS